MQDKKLCYLKINIKQFFTYFCRSYYYDHTIMAMTAPRSENIEFSSWCQIPGHLNIILFDLGPIWLGTIWPVAYQLHDKIKSLNSKIESSISIQIVPKLKC